jgi:hypothetical protein
MIGEYRSTIIFTYCGFKLLRQVMSVENIVTQHQSAAVIADKLFTDDKRLCKAIWTWLYFILQIQSPLAAITQ